MFQTEKGQNHHWIWRTTHVKVSTRAMVLNLYSYQNYLEALFKHRLPGLPPKVSKVEPKIRISNSFPAAEARWAILLWKALHEKVVISEDREARGESHSRKLRNKPWAKAMPMGYRGKPGSEQHRKAESGDQWNMMRQGRSVRHLPGFWLVWLGRLGQTHEPVGGGWWRRKFWKAKRVKLWQASNILH